MDAKSRERPRVDSPPERLEGDREPAYRDRLMHAVTIGAAALVKAASLDLAMPEALRILGETLGVDRVVVVHSNPAPELLYIWQRPEALPQVDKSSFKAAAADTPALLAWRAQLNEGKPLVAQRATSEGLVRAMLVRLGEQSLLTVPIFAGAKNWVNLGAELRDAIDAGQLFLMYQPQVAIADGRISGVEALLRWRHPERGVLSPDLFIPIAERIGIIGRLGHWVLWAACRQARLWLDAGLAPVRIAVNVSALQFKASIALEADVAATLRETRLPPHLLELELTETVLMGMARERSDAFDRLRTTGVTIAIDDFGTGYSSLEYLRRFPVERIKIAQVFVKELETKHDDAAIARATIGLARELGIDVIAEGVETEAQAELVAGWRCKEAQGFLFSRPLSAEDATAALKAGVVRRRAPC
jgi:EAL domain-containing protein (putative c-di-GMP-specific phosphodiesterase class I)